MLGNMKTYFWTDAGDGIGSWKTSCKRLISSLILQSDAFISAPTTKKIDEKTSEKNNSETPTDHIKAQILVANQSGGLW
jgi:hypothetical protein